MITIEEVLLGGVIPSEFTHPDLVPQQMTDECYSQWTDELNQGQSKKVIIIRMFPFLFSVNTPIRGFGFP